MADHLQATSGPTGSDSRVSGLRVSLLGSMQVELGGQPLHVAGRQRRRLLALLAIRAGRVVPVEALVDAMWGDDPPPSAAKTVQSHMVRLRQSLAEAGEPIETTPGGYRLNVDPANTDMARFDRLATQGAVELRAGHCAAAVKLLEASLAIWRGPALLEFTTDDFAVGDRTRLEERRLVALEDLAEARLGIGAAPLVVPDMERVVADAPGRERAWALLMRALYASGRQHDALAAYQRARAVLGDEFGLEPGPALRELEQRIVDQDPDLIGPRARAALPAALRDDAAFVGRAHELAWLHAAWDRACGGVGQVRTVLGAFGSGRTRLVGELAASVVADGGAVEYVPGTTGLDVLGDGSGPGSVIDAVAARCRMAPLMVVVDDMEWTPPSGIEAIRALASAAERLTLLLVLVGNDAQSPAILLAHELERTSSATLELTAMSDHELAQMLATEGVDAEAAGAAVAMAIGLPGVARREAAAWAERAATERLNAAATVSIGARSAAAVAGASVLDEVLRLVEARGQRAALAGAVSVGRQPYRSLASYDASDADLFVGREHLVAELTARVLDRRLVAVVGASGSGKSSIVRAGLLPLVRSGRLPGEGAWRAHAIVPGHDPAKAIEMVPGLDEPGQQLLVIDQFEEVLASGQIEAVAARLLDVVLDPALDARIVLVVRADQLGALASSRALAEMIEDAQVLVGPPTDEELRRILVEPARRTGCSVDPQLVAMVLADVAGHDAALPLVSAAMAEVWERRDGDALRAADYEEIGGLAASVERLGDRALAAAGPQGRSSIRDVMLRLVDVTEDGAWIRRRVAAEEMPTVAGHAIDALLDARLVVHTGEALDVVHEVVFRAWPQMVTWLEEARADLTLERDLRAAARSWDGDGRSDDHVLRGGRLHAATEWAARCDHVPLPVSELIAASHEWAERDNRAIREQLAREQRGRRRLRGALVTASLLLVVALIGGLLAFGNSERADRQRKRADIAASQAAEAANAADQAAAEAESAAQLAEQRRADAQTSRLVAESHGNLDRDLSLSMLLAVEAHRTADTPATRGALLSTLTHNVSSVRAVNDRAYATPTVPHVKSSFLGFVAGPVRVATGMSVSKDGRIVATAGNSGTGQPGGSVLVFDTSLRQLIGTVPTAGRSSVAVKPDGSAVLAIEAAQIQTFDTDSGEIRVLEIRPPAKVDFVSASYTADGDRFVVTATDHKIRLFDASTFDPIDVELPDSPINTAGIAPDGTLAIWVNGLTFWDLTANREVRSVELETPEFIFPAYFAFSSDTQWLAGSEPQGGVALWNLDNGHLVGDPAGRPRLARPLAFDPVNPSVLAIGSADGGVTMFDVATDRPIGAPLRGLVGGVRALAFSGDGRLLVTTSDDGVLALWTDNSGPTLLSAPLADGDRLLAATVDGDVVVTGGQFYADVYRPTTSGREALHIDLQSQLDTPVTVAAPGPWVLSADGSVLFGGTGSGHMQLFDTSTGAVRWTHEDSRPIYIPGVSPDGGHVAFVVEDKLVEIWDVSSDRVVATFDIEDAYPGLRAFFTGPPQFGTDGTTVAIASSNGPVRFDIANGKASVGGGTTFLQGWISQPPDGDIIAGGLGGRLWRWDMDTGELIASGRSIDPTSLGGAFSSADGTLVAAPHPFTALVALFDGTLTPVGDPIPTGDVGEFSTVVLSSDGKRLFSNGPLNNATEWNLDVSTWEPIACHAAGRNLTQDEWDEYIGDGVPYRSTCPEWPSD